MIKIPRRSESVLTAHSTYSSTYSSTKDVNNTDNNTKNNQDNTQNANGFYLKDQEKENMPLYTYRYNASQNKYNNYNPTTRVTISPLSLTSSNATPRTIGNRVNKYSNYLDVNNLSSRNPHTQLIVEQVQKANTTINRRTPNELLSSQPLNAMQSARKPTAPNSDLKGMTIGKMMMMSNGERTKLVENRIQDRLLDKKLQEIQKQALKNEMQIKRARSMLLDEYMQSKAVHLNVQNSKEPQQYRPKTITQQMIQQSTYLPNYLKPRKLPSTTISQDYEGHLEKLKKVAEKNRSVCSRHKRHRMSGEYQLVNMTLDELEKFNQQINPQNPGQPVPNQIAGQLQNVPQVVVNAVADATINETSVCEHGSHEHIISQETNSNNTNSQNQNNLTSANNGNQVNSVQINLNSTHNNASNINVSNQNLSQNINIDLQKPSKDANSVKFAEHTTIYALNRAKVT